MAERQRGFYWCLIPQAAPPDTVEVAEWDGRIWLTTGWGGGITDDLVRVLSDRLDPPTAPQ